MPIVVVVHRLKNFDDWFKLFKADPPPKVGRGDCYAAVTTATEYTLLGRWQRLKLRP